MKSTGNEERDTQILTNNLADATEWGINKSRECPGRRVEIHEMKEILLFVFDNGHELTPAKPLTSPLRDLKEGLMLK